MSFAACFHSAMHALTVERASACVTPSVSRSVGWTLRSAVGCTRRVWARTLRARGGIGGSTRRRTRSVGSRRSPAASGCNITRGSTVASFARRARGLASTRHRRRHGHRRMRPIRFPRHHSSRGSTWVHTFGVSNSSMMCSDFDELADLPSRRMWRDGGRKRQTGHGFVNRAAADCSSIMISCRIRHP